jgi:hypothetical protein
MDVNFRRLRARTETADGLLQILLENCTGILRRPILRLDASCDVRHICGGLVQRSDEKIGGFFEFERVYRYALIDNLPQSYVYQSRVQCLHDREA